MKPLRIDDREEWSIINVVTEEGQRTKARNYHKASVATHHDHLHRVLFPAPASIRAGNKTRHNTAARSQAAIVTRSSAAGWLRPMMIAIDR